MTKVTNSSKRDFPKISLKSIFKPILQWKTKKVIAQKISFLTAIALMFSSILPLPALADYGDTLPLPQPPFKGKIGTTYKESQPDF
ncbi:MAG: arylsulfatase, partial [Pseudanabaena sp.]